MEKLTCVQLKRFLEDEKRGIKEYSKAGLNELARDEARHARFLRRKMKRC